MSKEEKYIKALVQIETRLRELDPDVNFAGDLQISDAWAIAEGVLQEKDNSDLIDAIREANSTSIIVTMADTEIIRVPLQKGEENVQFDENNNLGTYSIYPPNTMTNQPEYAE